MAALLAYVTRNALGVAESTVRGDLGITKEQSGWLMSMFFWPYALCQIPGAWLGQRIGARRALPLFGVLWSLASAGLAAGSYVIMLIMRMFMGVSQAGLVPVGMGVMARWVPRTEQGIASGTFVGEVVMKDEMTAFLKAVQARGCRFQVGADMLFEQIPAYLEFFGLPATTPDVLRAVARLG